MTESGSRTQKLGIDKIKDAWSCACMECGIFQKSMCEDGVPVVKGMEKPKAKGLKHLSV